MLSESRRSLPQPPSAGPATAPERCSFFPDSSGFLFRFLNPLGGYDGC